MSTSSSSDLLASYQQRVSSLEAENAFLQTEKDSLTRIATETLSLLSSLDDKVRPKGFWAQEGDQTQMMELEGSRVHLSVGKAWEWTKIAKSTVVRPKLPLIETYSIYGKPRPEIVPFKGSFPLEIFERIVMLCGPGTMAVFARSSLACLDIFAPRMLRTVNIGEYGRLSELFTERDLTLFPRLTQSLSLQNIQVLVVPASALEHIRSHELSASRFAPGDHVLRLQKMTIYMDRSAVNHPHPPSDGYHSEWDEDEQGPSFRTFDPKPSLLSLLDPERLVFRRGNPLETLFDNPYALMRKHGGQDERMFRISRVGARVISNWSRLKYIDLLDVDLFVLDPQTLPDNEIALLRNSAVNEDPKAFFLGLGGAREIFEQMSTTNASKEWNVRWFVNQSGTVRPFERGWSSLPNQLVGRDWTLINNRIKSAVIVVGSGSKEKVEAQLAETKEADRGPLKVAVA